jgi:hypothetical protein
MGLTWAMLEEDTTSIYDKRGVLFMKKQTTGF